MNETQSNDGYFGNKLHRIINIEQDDTISITSYPNENKSENSVFIINLVSSEINVEFINIHSYTQQDISKDKFDDVSSVNLDPYNNEPEEQNHIINEDEIQTKIIEGNKLHHFIEFNQSGITSSTNESESAKSNLIIQFNSSEMNNENNKIDDNIHQDFNKVEHGKTAFISTDPNVIKLKKQQYSFKNERFHFGDKLYECEMCIKTFFDSTTLARHARTHHDDDLKTPNLYKKSLPQKKYKRDIGDTLYKCEICYKAFFNLSSLAKHVRFHYNK